MTFPEIDPVIFPIGPLALRWYALAYLAGIVLGWVYVRRLAANTGLWGARAPVATKDQVEDIVLWVVLGVILGGRLGYMLFYNTQALWQAPFEFFMIWRGGMSFHGGLIGVAIAFWWVAKLQKMDLLKVSDLVSPVIPIGLFFGRIANFVNAELWGRETYSPFGMVFCNDTIRKYNNGGCPAGMDTRHPSQLYEAGLEGLLLFVILWFAVYRLGLLKRRGAVTGMFLVGYAIFRMLVENVREPDAALAGWPFGLTMGMVLSLPMLLAGGFLIWRSTTAKGEPAAGLVDPNAKTPGPVARTVAGAIKGGVIGGGAAGLLDDDVSLETEDAVVATTTAAGAAIGAAAPAKPQAKAKPKTPAPKSVAARPVAKKAPPPKKPTVSAKAKPKPSPKPKPAK